MKSIKKRGRKPIEDKKKPITIFVKESFIEKIGKEELQQKLLDYIEYLEKSKFSEWKEK